MPDKLLKQRIAELNANNSALPAVSDDKEKRTYSIEEIQQILDISRSTAYLLIKRKLFKGAKKVAVGFVGLEDDFEVCRRIFLYAYQCVETRCKRIRARERERGGKEVREMCNAYGWGFCGGLEAAFQEQEKEHQEWGLVLTVPQAVEDVINKMSKPTSFGTVSVNGWRAKYANAGYAEGKKFVPEQQLEPGNNKQQVSA